MSSDETLYSRQNSKEIDEALAWLESLGDNAATRRSARSGEPTAFMRLPSWLRQDIRIDLPEPTSTPIQAPPMESDNLSWLDAIASGSGGVVEEPPTMQWAESAVESIPQQDEATELYAPDEPDYNLDAPTQVSRRRPNVDDELTTTIVPRSEMEIGEEFEPTSIIPELSDEAMALIEDEAQLEPTSLILPDDSADPFSFDALFDEPTRLINDDTSQEPPNIDSPDPETFEFDELTSLLPPTFDPLEEFEPTEIIDSQADLFEPTDYVEPGEFGDDDSTHLLLPERSDSELEEPVAAEVDEPIAEIQPDEFGDYDSTHLLLPERSDSELEAPVAAEVDEPIAEIQPDAFGDDDSTHLLLPERLDDDLEEPVAEIEERVVTIQPFDTESSADTSASATDTVDANETDEPTFPPIDEIDLASFAVPEDLSDEMVLESSADLDSAAPEPVYDTEPTALYMPDDSELDALLDTATPPSSEPASFEDSPTELFFDDYAAMAASLDQAVEAENTEIILPSAQDFPDFDFPELDSDTAPPLPDAAEQAEEPAPAVEQSIEGLSFYEDEPTEPSLVRPQLEISPDEATQYFVPQDSAPMNLFEPTIVSEISIAERWQAIPSQFRPRKRTETEWEDEANLAASDSEPTETISKVLHIADDIPDDPDETIAWLEEMARQQKMGISAEKTATDDEPPVAEFKFPDEIADDIPTLLAEPEISADVEPEISADVEPERPDEDAILDTSTKERLPANFFDEVDGVSPTIIADVGQSAEDGMDAFVREVSDVLDDEREPFEPASRDDNPSAESEEELRDALAWLEELVTGGETPIDEMTIELNETDVNRLLDSYRPSEFNQPVQDISDHPTLITQHPGMSENDELPVDDDLDAALSWLEGLNFDEESSLIEPPSPVERSEAPVTMIDYSAALNSARHAFQSESYNEAIIIFEDLLQREDKNATDLVIEDLIEWTGKVQDHAPFYRLLGDAYLQRGDYEKAAWTFRRGLTV